MMVEDSLFCTNAVKFTVSVSGVEWRGPANVRQACQTIHGPGLGICFRIRSFYAVLGFFHCTLDSRARTSLFKLENLVLRVSRNFRLGQGAPCRSERASPYSMASLVPPHSAMFSNCLYNKFVSSSNIFGHKKWSTACSPWLESSRWVRRHVIETSNSQYGRFSYGAACSESPPYLVDSPFGDDFGVGRDLRARRFLCSRPYCELLD